MKQWLVDFSVNNHRSQQVVSSFTSIEAKKLIEAQYSGQKVTFFGVKAYN